MKHYYSFSKILFLLPFLFIGQNTLAQLSVTVNPSKDNTLIESSTGAKSNAKATELYSGRVSSVKYPNEYKRRAIMEFDVSSVPAGATIDSVVLTIRCTKARFSTSRSHSLHLVNSEWGEGTSSFNGGKGANSTNNDATWIHTFYSGSNWSSSGGDYNAIPSATANIAGVGNYTFKSTAMKNDVQSWVNNSSNNHGWILIGDESVNQSVKHIGSRENTSTNRPQLTIYYSCTKADFTSTFGCVNKPIQFTNTSINGSSYRWDFDNDGIYDDTTKNPSHTFTSFGNKPIKLVSITSGGCRDSITKNVLVLSNPNVSFTHDTGCTDGILNFTSVSNGVKYEWDWDNDNVIDNTVTTLGTTHTFTTAGTKMVRLRMTDFGGCVGEKTQQVEVYTKPTAAFTTDKVCGKSTTTFKNNSTAATTSNKYKWDFDGDGTYDDSTFNTNDVLHTYSTGGIKPAKLLLVSEHNCKDSVTNNVTVDSIPLLSLHIDTVCLSVSTNITDNSTAPINSVYKWDFDNDGVYDDFTAGNKNYLYSTVGKNAIKLVVSALNGCIDSLTEFAVIEPGITASVNADTACLGNTTIFTDNSTTTSSAAYSWDFDNDGIYDDNTKGNNSNLYTIGIHTVKLFIIDADGCKDSTTFNIEVKPLPTVNYTADSVCFGTPTTFTDNSTAGNNATYKWDFNNDGIIDDNTVGNTSTIYNVSGTAESKLHIEDEFGCVDSATIDVLVKQKPGASFTINQNDPDVTLTNTTTGTVNSFEWDFGDGNTNNTNLNPTHTYTNSNTYNICLKATNECGDSVTCQNISIIGSYTSNIKLDNAFIITPNPFSNIVKVNSLAGYNYSLNVTDLQGRVMYTDTNGIGTTTLNLNELSKGIYFIIIETKIGTVSYKIIKSE